MLMFLVPARAPRTAHVAPGIAPALGIKHSAPFQ
jgi:hypothetical protein